MKTLIIGIVCLGIGVLLPKLVSAICSYINNKNPKESGEEGFSWSKFFSGFSLFNPVAWGKRVVSIFWNLVIYGVIVAIIMGIGYYGGWNNRPVNIPLGYNKEAIIAINDAGDYIHIQKDGNVYIKNKDNKVIRQIKLKDIPNLKSALAPYGLIMKPIFIAGSSYGTNGQLGGEVGVGVSFIRLWKVTVDAFITSFPALYLGTSYDVTDSFGVGIGVGQSLRELEDKRIIIYGRFRF